MTSIHLTAIQITFCALLTVSTKGDGSNCLHTKAARYWSADSCSLTTSRRKLLADHSHQTIVRGVSPAKVASWPFPSDNCPWGQPSDSCNQTFVQQYPVIAARWLFPIRHLSSNTQWELLVDYSQSDICPAIPRDSCSLSSSHQTIVREISQATVAR